MFERLRRARFEIAIIVVFAALCVLNAFTYPVFEGMDEGPHFIYVDYLADERQLPDLNTFSYERSYQVSQSPLYYALASPLLWPLDRSDLEEYNYLNPRAGVPIAYDHSLADLDFPPQKTLLAVRALRLFSAAISLLTLLFVYAAAKEIGASANAGNNVARVALLITALNPKFIHLASSISNDPALFCAASAFVYFAARALRQNTPAAKDGFALGALAALAFLFKLHGLILLAPLGFIFAYFLWRGRRNPYPVWRFAACAALGFALVAGWYLAYNTLHYGDPFAAQQAERAHAGNRYPAPIAFFDVLAQIPTLINSHWSHLGYGLQIPDGFRLVYALLFAASCAGLGVRLFRKKWSRQLSLLAALFAVMFVVWVWWAWQFQGMAQTRLMGPAFAAIQVLSAFGLSAWAPAQPTRLGRAGWMACAAAGALMAALVAPLTILPAYFQFKPLRLSAAQTAALPAGGSVKFDNGIELVAAQMTQNRAPAGKPIELSLFWRATRPITAMHMLTVDVIDTSGAVLRHYTETPFPGYDTTRWGARSVMSQTIQLSVAVTQTTLAGIWVGWHEYDRPDAIAKIASGGGVSARVAEVKVMGSATPPAAPPSPKPLAVFAQVAALEDVQVNQDRVKISLRAIGSPNKPLTFFAHALDSAGAVIGQNDWQPDYPASFWDSGDYILAEAVVPGADAAAALRIGLYDQTGARVKVLGADNQLLPDDVFILRRGSIP